jgi:hypothetical protein
MQMAAPLGGKQTVDPVDKWACVLNWSCRALTGLSPSNLTGGFNQSLCCEEEEDLQGAEWNQGKHGKQPVAKVVARPQAKRTCCSRWSGITSGSPMYRDITNRRTGSHLSVGTSPGHELLPPRWKVEVGNVTSKCNGITCYRFCLAVLAITFRSDNGKNVTRVITISSDKRFFMPRPITFRSNNVSPQHKALCDNNKM